MIRPLESDDFRAAGGKVGGLERGLNRLEAGIAKHSLADALGLAGGYRTVRLVTLGVNKVYMYSCTARYLV